MRETAKRIGVLAAGHGAVDFYIPIIPAILPMLLPIFAGQGITSYAMAGFLVTAVTIVMACMQPVAGWIQDRGGWTLGASWCILMSACAIGCFSFVQNYWLLLTLAIITGLGNALFHPNAYQQIYEFSLPSNRGSLLSLFSIGGSFGYGAAPLVAGTLLVLAGLPGLIYLIIPGIIVAAIIARFPQRPKVSKPKEFAGTVPQRQKNWKLASLVLCISSCRTWVYYGFLAFATVYLTKYAGVDFLLATGLVTGMFYAGMFGTMAAGITSDKFGRKEIMFASYLCAVPAYLGVFFLPDGFALLSLLAAGFFLMAPAAIEIATVQELMPGSVGFASGLVVGFPQALSAVAIFVIGILADLYGMPITLISQAALMGVAAILCSAMPRPESLREK